MCCRFNVLWRDNVAVWNVNTKVRMGPFGRQWLHSMLLRFKCNAAIPQHSQGVGSKSILYVNSEKVQIMNVGHKNTNGSALVVGTVCTHFLSRYPVSPTFLIIAVSKNLFFLRAFTRDQFEKWP